MARPKLIEDSVLLALIKRYFDEECNNDTKKLKASEITRYINSHGYPDYPATTLRRTPAAMEYIEELKKITKNEHYITVVAYRTIDAASMVDSNRSRDRLIAAITERDCYYKKIADSAAYHFERYGNLQQAYAAVKQHNAVLLERIAKLEEQIDQLKFETKQLNIELKAAHTVIDTYIYPEVANELLVKEGAKRKTMNILKVGALEKNLITPTTDIKAAIKSDSNVLKGLLRIGDE